MRLSARRLVVGLLVVATIASARAWAQTEPASCDVAGQNLFVRDVLDDLYLWYRQLPRVDPATFPSPEAYLEAVRYRPLDRGFSYITSRESNDAFFDDSQFIGLGFTTRVTGQEMHLLQVFPDSPAAEAGLARGTRILAIDGEPVAQLIDSGRISGAFGPAEPGLAVSIEFQDRGREPRRAVLTKRLVTIPTVSLTRVFDVAGRRVGYIFFRNFVRPSYEALDEAFRALQGAGAHDLVLDLRYNGGGLVDVAVHLASLVGGALTRGRVFATFEHNDKNTFRDVTLRFREARNALGLPRLVVITSRSSASASELIINSLRPFIPVVIVGDATYGKPVGQYGIPFCDKIVSPVAFTLRNARGQADYFDGLPADCAAPDDVEYELGDGREGSLAEALRYVRDGACRTPSPLRPRPPRRLLAEPIDRAVGWQSVVNAY